MFFSMAIFQGCSIVYTMRNIVLKYDKIKSQKGWDLSAFLVRLTLEIKKYIPKCYNTSINSHSNSLHMYNLIDFF